MVTTPSYLTAVAGEAVGRAEKQLRPANGFSSQEGSKPVQIDFSLAGAFRASGG